MENSEATTQDSCHQEEPRTELDDSEVIIVRTVTLNAAKLLEMMEYGILGLPYVV